jgi:transcriptional regulator with XRE-family HTH domain
MTALAQAIAELRRRLGWTTTELAQHLGVSQASASRYERGKMDPGYLVLERLFWLAKGPEKKPIMDALEVALNERLPSRLTKEEEGSIGDILPVRAKIRPRRPNLSRFAEVANIVISAGDEIDPAVVEILELWLELRMSLNPKVRAAFEDAGRFLRVSLAGEPRLPRQSGDDPAYLATTRKPGRRRPLEVAEARVKLGRP